MQTQTFVSKPQHTYFDGEGSPTDPPAEKSNSNDDGGGAPNEGGDPKNKSFTQAEVNEMLAKERKRSEERTKKTVEQLEHLKNSKNLSDSEKTTLQAKIDELQTSLMTKEELAKKNEEKLKNMHNKEIEKLTKEKEIWQERFTNSTILRSISDAAHENEAFNPHQVIALLRPMTTLKEKTDADGNPIGIFEPRVKYPDLDKEGKEVTLDLSVPEAVKRMKDTTDKYGNLFKSTAAGGLGMGQGVQGKTGPVDLKSMTPEQYKEYRSRLGLAPSTVRK